MTLERQNPLPTGRYWQDIISTLPDGTDNATAFRTWLEKNKESVVVETTASHEAEDGAPARDFYIFTVKTPVDWDQKHWGFPTIATKEVKAESDTVQRPDPEQDPIDKLRKQLDEASKTAKSVLSGVTIVGVAAGIAWLVSKLRRKGS